MLLDELAIIERFFRPLAGEGAFGLIDDAALIKAPDGFDLVTTVDMVAAGIHFLPNDPADTIAQKALRVNISDLVAKGATPVCYLLGLGLPAETSESWVATFAEGLAADQSKFSVSLLGGDTISVPAGPVVSITAFGTVPSGMMRHRFGGRPGDMLYVSGSIGAAAVGLALLKEEEEGPWSVLPGEARELLVRSYRLPDPKAGLAPALREHASAAMDVSDGLVGDCDKLCVASKCSADIEAERVPLPPGLGALDDDMLARLLTAGDDYEILAAVPPGSDAGFRARAAEAGVLVTRIGRLVGGDQPVRVMHRGQQLPLARRAYTHGRGSR